MEKTTQELLQTAERYAPLMLEAFHWLWKNPEPGFREWKSTAYLEEQWEKLGYVLTRPGDIPGFVTDLDTGRPGPKLLILAELDSLIVRDHPEADPETGAVHACGHCCQGAALLGVAAAMREPGMLDGLCGSIRFAMVPAEELIEIAFRQELKRRGVIRYFGGKPEFLYRGLFDGCDLSFMIHTGGGGHQMNLARGSNGCIAKDITFTGVEAHAGGSPWDGINALYAANLGMTAVNALRETFREQDYIRFHPIVTDGGKVVNNIPSRVTMESYVRGATCAAITAANRRINRALAASAAAMGGNVILRDSPGYMPLTNDPGLREVYRQAAEAVVGRERVGINDGQDTGCTDMGDISMVMPAIHGYCGGAEGRGHGSNYRIADPDCAVVDPARVQLLLLHLLLSDGAARAREVVAGFRHPFASLEDFFAARDAMFLDRQAVEYGEDGITLRIE